MSRSLPPRPTMEHLKKEAKEILHAYKARDAGILPTLRRLHRFSKATDAEIFAAEVALQEVQFALAMDYGLESWDKLKAHVNGILKTSPRAIDYTQVKLSGHGFEIDSFCLAVQEGSAVLGRPQQYETVLALTLNAFAPGFDTGNDCKELWVGQGWMSHVGPLDTAWDSLGLSADPVHLPERPGDSGPQRESYRRACASAIQAALVEGAVVLVTGGWECGKGRWVEPWRAGIVTSVSGEGTVLGAHLNGRLDNEITDFWPGQVLALKPRTSTRDIVEMTMAILKSAVDRVRAKAPHYSRREYSAFGVDAMDEWTGQMERVAYFCPVCHAKGKPGWQSAAIVARAMIHRATVAAAFLREQFAGLPDAAQRHLKNAAAHYDSIRHLLAPATAESGAESYQEFIGDLEKQRRHAKRVLEPVKSGLLAAAEQMDRALASLS